MTTFAIIALTVLGTILIFILIIGLIGTRVSIEEMDSNKVESFLSDKEHFVEAYDLTKVIYRNHSEPTKELTANEIAQQLVQTMFRALHDQPTEPIESYLKNLSEYKKIIDDSPDKFLDFYFQDSIRDEQYELSQYISDVAKKRGMILKAEV